MLKKQIKKILPTKLKKNVNVNRLLQNYYYDFKRFNKYSGTLNAYKTQSIHEAKLTFQYHQIEKGLSLKEPRKGFGKKKVEDLIDSLNRYISKYGTDRTSEVCINVLKEYLSFQKKNEYADYEFLLNVEKEIRKFPVKINEGGLKKITKSSIINESTNFNFEKFANSRHSIRNFTDESVDLSLIEKAIQIAQKTPSVCNRQSWKVHIYKEKEDISEVLKYQNGNKGFGEDVNKLIIVTADLNSFFSIGERNQAYTDGGMFSMSLVYALHSLGLGTCCLNCSIKYQTDINLRKVAKINESEVIIMMIAVGNIPADLNVAYSPRKNSSEVITLH